MSNDPRSFNHPDRKTLAEADVAGLGDAILVLTKEIWVLTDRLAAVEAVLAGRGIDIRDELEQFKPDKALNEKLAARGQKLIAELTSAMAGLSRTDDASRRDGRDR